MSPEIVVVFFNMLGMPWFYVFMIRRYLGIETRTRPRDEKALDRFLAGCGIGRDELSAGQMSVLRSYCRMHRLRKWAAITTALLGALLLCSASYVSRICVPMLSDLTPSRCILVDTSKNSRKEISPDPDLRRLYVQNAMVWGSLAGMFGISGAYCLVFAALLPLANADRKAWIAYLKAGKKDD